MDKDKDKEAIARGSVYTERIRIRIRRALLATGKFKLTQLDKASAMIAANVVDELVKIQGEGETDEKTA